MKTIFKRFDRSTSIVRENILKHAGHSKRVIRSTLAKTYAYTYIFVYVENRFDVGPIERGGGACYYSKFKNCH